MSDRNELAVWLAEHDGGKNKDVDVVFDSNNRLVMCCNGGQSQKMINKEAEWCSLFKSPFKAITTSNLNYHKFTLGLIELL